MGWLRIVSEGEGSARLRDWYRRATSWLAQSTLGLVLLQVPLMPFLFLRAPRALTLDFGPLAGGAALLMTAATLWYQFRPTL